MPDRQLFPIDEIPNDLSRGEWICQDFRRYLNLLCMRKQCFFLPVELKRMRMRNVGRPHEFATRFDTYNAVVGLCGTGKTTLIRSVASVFGLETCPQSSAVNHERSESAIELDVSESGSFHMKIARSAGNQWARYEPFNCLLVDDPCRELTDEGYKKFLLHLKGLEKQIVITMGSTDDERSEMINSVFPGCNIIRLQRGD